MNSLGYELENHMVQGEEAYKDAAELTADQEIDLFKEWYESKEAPIEIDIYELFEEEISYKERYSWMINGQLHNVFNGWMHSYLAIQFQDKSDVLLTPQQIKETI